MSLFLPAQKKKSPKDLPPQHRKWLEEDVVYIISQKERDIFLQLESDRERNIFIDAFWKIRDSNPDTPENEFKIEHFRRITYANQWYGRESPTPGWRTDMGKVYIRLGEPKEIQRFESLPEVRPMIIWFYDGMSEYGLPGSFYVAFFKRDISGEYRLYSPINDGPQNLLIHYAGDMTEYLSAFEQLYAVDPAIATVSLSLIPGEAMFSLAPSMASEVLIRQSIPAAPYEKVKTDYADKLLRYKDVIEVDYTSNYIDSDALVKVFQDPAGQSFVHYALEPKSLKFLQVQDRYRAEIQVNGKISDAQGRTVYQFDRTVPLDIDEDQLAKIRPKTFSFQDLFPLVPGQYKMNLLWKNTISKEFTSIEADLLIPDPASFSMSSPVLAFKVDKDSKYKGLNKSFLLGNIQFVPSPHNIFLPGETLYLFFQLHGLPADVKSGGSVEYTIFKEDVKVHSLTRSLTDVPGQTDFFEEFPLTGYTAAHYQIKIAVLNAEKQEKLSTQIPFDITPITSLTRPWVLSLPLPPSNDPSLSNILGLQYLNKNDPDKARPLLELAFRRDPNSVKYALDFCQVLAKAKDYQGVKQTALPFLKDERKYDFLQLAGEASQALGQYAEAIAYFKDYLAHFGTNIPILNAIGECYFQLGNAAEALAAWERSLKLEPNQPALKERVRVLKEKK
jgi:GWxTD domain-containing protein